MKVKNLITTAIATITTITALNIILRYLKWQRDILTNLQTTSTVTTTAFGTIEYTISGTGPALLILHGSPGGYDQGAALAHFLDLPGFTCIAPSRPGYLHTPLESGRTPEQQADLYTALLDTLGIARAAVIGLSGGGPSAIQFALRHPERCTGLILMCAVSRRYNEQEVNRGLAWDQRLIRPLADKLLNWNPAVFLLSTLARRLPEQIPSAFINTLALYPMRKAGYVNDMQEFEHISYTLASIQVPTLLMHGTADSTLPFADSEQAVKAITGARLIAFEGEDHFFFIPERERVRTELLAFLQTVA